MMHNTFMLVESRESRVKSRGARVERRESRGEARETRVGRLESRGEGLEARTLIIFYICDKFFQTT